MQTALTYRTNRDLFSNHYLDDHLPETEAWEEVSDAELEEARADLRELWEQEKGTAPKRNESQLERAFIRPMFETLGIPFEVEESTSRTQRRPDYGFFETDQAARDAFERREEGGDFYENAVAVADAKRWGRALDTRGSGEHERDFENPSYQIHVYLQETPAEWAVLTNGKKWRLYYAPTSHRLDSYYEIDLPTVLESGDLEAFKYFYLFFRHEAFIPDASGDSFLDDVYDESNLFAQELGEDLQDNIYEAIKVLAEGFLEYPENDLDEDDLGLVHDSSLIYLYRLIFVLYAESEGRDLLNTNNEIYEESYSLNTLKEDVADELDSSNPSYRTWQDGLWSRLDELFTLIDQGSKSRGIPEDDLYIPAYNGGLFRTAPDEDGSREAVFLANHAVGDAHLARVIDLLARSQVDEGGKTFVDYSSLGVRHLGSVYEGLLEYELNVADEPLALTEGEYAPAEADDEIAVEAGDVYLTTGSGERKATGSYYTPEYVVEYIVEETLGPLVEDIREDLVAQSARGDQGFAEEFAERVFELKILDPAMGSGHFLTSAVDYLAREIIDAQEKQAAQQGVDTIDEDHDINWARRKVAQRCIYGVDLNPLAVELAKVSLWLRTLAAEQPLAFLDHHLKAGNSLVGSDIEDVLTQDEGATAEGGQLTLQQSFDHTRQQALEHVMERFTDLLAIDNETLDDIKEMEKVYEAVRDDDLYQHLLAMANVHTASEFGLDVPDDAEERMAEALRSDSWSDIEDQDWFTSAQAMADDEQFFHWELEYPVAFYGENGERLDDAGFDAVIGNPPYIKTQNLRDKLPQVADYLISSPRYTTTTGRFDIYAPFVELGVSLASKATVSYILPNKFFTRAHGEPLRRYLTESSLPREILDFGQNQVFSGATTYTCILRLQKKSDYFNYRRAQSAPESAGELRSLRSVKIALEDLGTEPWVLTDPQELQVLRKMEQQGVTIGDVSEEVAEGITSGDNDVLFVRIIDSTNDSLVIESPANGKQYELEPDLVKPLTDGDNINRYEPPESNFGVIYPYTLSGEDTKIIGEEQLCETYPKTYSYLSDFKSRLANRGTARTNDEYKTWYAHYRPRDMRVFEEPKLLTPDICGKSEFSIDDTGGLYFRNSAFGFVPKRNENSTREFYLGVLNSTLTWFYIYQTSTVLENDFRRFTKSYLSPLPIPSIVPESDPTEVETIYDEEMVQYYQNSCSPDYSEGTTFIAYLARREVEFHESRHSLNLSLLDYLGNYTEGPNLPDVGLFQPTSENILDATTEDYEKLRVGDVRTERDGRHVTITATARYKPEDEEEFETDQWGYTETDYMEAFTLNDLSEEEATLVEAFVPVAVAEAGGFAGFRENATKTNSLLDRLKAITLPDPDDVAADLRRYIDVRERADELDAKIEKTDELIDQIVYDLYGLTDEEIEIVESAVGAD